MKFIVIGYWLWFGVAVLFLLRRVLLRATGRNTKATPRADALNERVDDLAARVIERAARLGTAEPVAAASDAEETAGPAAMVVEPISVDPPAAVAEPVAPPAPLPPPPTLAAAWSVEPTSVAEPTPREALAGESMPAAANVHPLSGTVFAPMPTPSRSPIAGNRRSIADALRGIVMPNDLAPLSMMGADFERRAVLSTNSAPVSVVGAQLAAELARLGYELEPTGMTDAMARRGEDVLSVKLRTVGPAPKKGPADPAYPTASAGAVVVDVELTY